MSTPCEPPEDTQEAKSSGPHEGTITDNDESPPRKGYTYVYLVDVIPQDLPTEHHLDRSYSQTSLLNDPQKCICCGRLCRQSLISKTLPIGFGSGYQIDLPVCNRCYEHDRISEKSTSAFGMGIVLFLWVLVSPLIIIGLEYSHLLAISISLVFLIAGVSCMMLSRMFRRRERDARTQACVPGSAYESVKFASLTGYESYRGHILLECKNKTFAAAFAKANGGTIQRVERLE